MVTQADEERLEREYYEHFTKEQLVNQHLAKDKVLHQLTGRDAYVIGKIQLLYQKP